MRNFHDWGTKFALIDISIKNLQSTWSNFIAQVACSKNDWFFSHDSMDGKIPENVFAWPSAARIESLPSFAS